MKKAAVIALLTGLFAMNAHATKARVNSLLGAKHLVDSQTIFEFPADANALGQYLTLEMGPTGDGSTSTRAEGGMFRKYSDAIIGIYLGHHDTFQSELRTLRTYQMQTNPVQIFYAKDNWGLTVGLSNTDKKTTKVKETTAYAGFGQTLSNVSWGANAEIIANAEKDTSGNTDKLEGAPVLSAQFRTLADQYFHGKVAYGDMKDKVAAGDIKLKSTDVEFGWIDRTLKAEGRDLYYGISLAYSDYDIDSKHVNSTSLPLSVGFEQALNSWATARASLQQNFLLGSKKDETATSPADETDTIANNTTVSAGLGFKYQNLTLDGVLAAATSGDINGNAVLAQAGLIYSF